MRRASSAPTMRRMISRPSAAPASRGSPSSTVPALPRPTAAPRSLPKACPTFSSSAPTACRSSSAAMCASICAPAPETYTLNDMSEEALEVLRTRSDIACVLVNPLQALHPNANAPSDGSLVDSGRSANFDRQAYANWLGRLREVCTEQGIVLILDEIFVG